MAKRGLSGLAQGFNEGYDTVGRVIKDYEIGKIANAKEETGYSAEDGAQLEAIANAKDENGNPYYKVGTDDKGKYTVTPVNAPAAAGGINPPERFTDTAAVSMPQGRTEFLGKEYKAPLTDTQRDSARTMAMAGVYDKQGDPEKAFALRTQAAQLDRTAAQDQRETQRFGREQKQWERQDVEQAREEDYKAKRSEIMANSPFAQIDKKFQAESADYQARLDAYNKARSAPGMEVRDLASLGAPPVAPKREQVTPGQMALSYAQLVDHDAQFGKLSTDGYMAFGDKLQSLRKEGYGDALKKLNSGASLDDVAKAFNASGDVKFDAKSVISDRIVKGADGVPSRVITFKDENGTHSINAVQELDAIGQAEKIYSRYYQGKSDARADKADGRAGAAEGRAAENYKQGKDEKAAAVKAGVELYQETNPTATPAQLAAVKAGVLPAVPSLNSNAPAEVKLAQAMVNAGMAPDMRTALEVAITKKGQSGDSLHSDFVQAGIKNMAPAADAVAKADEAMAAMGYSKKNGRWGVGESSAATVAKFGTAAEADAAAKSGKLKAGDKVEINGRTATYKP